MADYTNYSLVTWTDLTPISSVRLNQISTNIEQVKIANEDKPKGLLQISNTVITNGSSAAAEFANIKLISLDLVSGVDKRVTLDGQRYYRLNLVLPGLTQQDPGGEDGKYEIRFCKGNGVSAANILTTFTVLSGIGAYIDLTNGAAETRTVSTEAPSAVGTTTVAGNTKIRGSITFGAGVYSFVYSNTKVNESFFVEIARSSDASAANPSTWAIVTGGESSVQFYIEDIGGVA
jgi:hypothetical protein